MTREIKQLSNHVTICGFGRIGRILAEDFAARGIKFVVIELDDATAADAESAGHLVVVGDATEEDVLLSAGIKHASTAVVALDSDANNVFLTLTARNLNHQLRIIARGEQPATQKKLHQTGASRVVMPAMIGARRIANIVTHPHATEVIDLVTDRTQLDASLEEITVVAGSRLADSSVRDARPRETHGILVVALRREDGTVTFNPDPDIVIHAGDTAIVMGRTEDIERFRTDYVS